MNNNERYQDHWFVQGENMMSEGCPNSYYRKSRAETPRPIQVFKPYEREFSANSATLDLEHLIPNTSIDEGILIQSCLSYLGTLKSNGHEKGSIKGIVGEVAVKMAFDQIFSRDRRFVKAENEYRREGSQLYRIHDKLMGYRYFREDERENDKSKWLQRDKKEYDGVVFVRSASGVYFPVVIEVKMAKNESSVLNESMSPGKVEKKLEQISRVFPGDLGYGIVTIPENITGRSPLQDHFRRAGGFVAALPMKSEDIGRIVDILHSQL